MDETPEELEEIRRQAEKIDTNKYGRRYRFLMTLVLAVFLTAVVWVAVHMAVASRNPCERLRDYLCRKAPLDAVKCNTYQVIYKESVEDQNARMRGVIRDQCLTKINRLHDEDGVTVE